MRVEQTPADALQLIPASDDALRIGVSAAAEPGKLAAHLVIETENVGTFVVPLTAGHLGVLAAVGHHLLGLTEEQAAAMRKQLEQRENRK